MLFSGHRVGWLPAEGFPLALWNIFADFRDVKLFMLPKYKVVSGIQTVWRWPEVTEDQERHPLLGLRMTLAPQGITGQRGNITFDRSLLAAVLYLLRHEKFGMVNAP